MQTPERTVVKYPLIATPENGATDADYSGVPESITFNRGETEKTFEVVAVNDDIDDDGETIALSFGTLPHRVNAGSQSTITIIDNDQRGITVSVTELAVPEGDTRTYTVVLHSAPTAPVTIDITGMANTDVSVTHGAVDIHSRKLEHPAGSGGRSTGRRGRGSRKRDTEPRHKRRGLRRGRRAISYSDNHRRRHAGDNDGE